VWPGTRCPLEADAPTALDYPTASICLARPSVIRTFALPQMSPIIGHKDCDAWAPVSAELVARSQRTLAGHRTGFVPCIGSRAR